jgi:peptide/nickel transport system ATP-binding protein
MSALNAAVSLRRQFQEAWRAHESGGAREFHSRLETLLTEVQLPATPDFLARLPGQISVGQAQRVMIALALLHRPSILIADEPTSALDPVTQAEIVRLLRHLNRSSGVALIYVSHDLISVLQLCHRFAVLEHGHIAETVAVREVASAQHPATLSLLNALPVAADLLVAQDQSQPLAALRPNRWSPRLCAAAPERHPEQEASPVGAWWTP